VSICFLIYAGDLKKILNIHHDISETAKHKDMQDLDRNPSGKGETKDA
jgi:hypothetical protein